MEEFKNVELEEELGEVDEYAPTEESEVESEDSDTEMRTAGNSMKKNRSSTWNSGLLNAFETL